MRRSTSPTSSGMFSPPVLISTVLSLSIRSCVRCSRQHNAFVEHYFSRRTLPDQLRIVPELPHRRDSLHEATHPLSKVEVVDPHVDRIRVCIAHNTSLQHCTGVDHRRVECDLNGAVRHPHHHAVGQHEVGCYLNFRQKWTSILILLLTLFYIGYFFWSVVWNLPTELAERSGMVPQLQRTFL